MASVLIVSKKKEESEAIAKMLRPFDLNRVEQTDSAQDARRRIQKNAYSLVIINAPLAHEFGTELALDILETDSADVMMLVRREQMPDIELRLENEPVVLIAKPISKALMLRDVRYILNTREKREALQHQNRRLQKKMDGLKLQFRAKLMLMSYLSMSEDEAHRYLQKQAMDSRRTPEAVARAVIDLYQARH